MAGGCHASSASKPLDRPGYGPAISADGRWVAFESWASNLLAGDTNGHTDVFLHDGQSATTTRVSAGPAGTQANSISGGATISADGAPFVRFTRAAADPDTSADVRVTKGGSSFRFLAVDLYSSVTPIPYEFTGLLGGITVFTATATVPNTFGNLATIPNPFHTAVIDTLIIRVTNPATPCCPNPAGLDNIVLTP